MPRGTVRHINIASHCPWNVYLKEANKAHLKEKHAQPFVDNNNVGQPNYQTTPTIEL